MKNPLEKFTKIGKAVVTSVAALAALGSILVFGGGYVSAPADIKTNSARIDTLGVQVDYTHDEIHEVQAVQTFQTCLALDTLPGRELRCDRERNEKLESLRARHDN